MARKLSKKEADQQQHQLQAKNRYWQNELDSLGIEPKRKTELNDAEELEKLADIIKQAMFQDYKVAYSEEGEMLIKKKHSRLLLLAGRSWVQIIPPGPLLSVVQLRH
jgi:hypothetical protein